MRRQNRICVKKLTCYLRDVALLLYTSCCLRGSRGGAISIWACFILPRAEKYRAISGPRKYDSWEFLVARLRASETAARSALSFPASLYWRPTTRYKKRPFFNFIFILSLETLLHGLLCMGICEIRLYDENRGEYNRIECHNIVSLKMRRLVQTRFPRSMAVY